MRIQARLVLFLSAAFASGCQEKGGPPQAVTFFVAASTKEAVEEIAALFEKEQGIEVKVSPGASNMLATQIAEGAPADLFLSASEEWAESLKTKGAVLESQNLLGNALVIAVPRGNPEGVKSPGDLTGDPVKKVALAGEKVPAGKYAEQALRSAGLAEQLRTKIVRGQDVRMTLAFVERGEAEAGIVYETDVRVSRKVETAYRFDPRSHDRIVYPLVLLRAAEKNENARKFHAFLRMAEARAVFERHGFAPPN
jgi:molybdate transport system substrate-binding protein